MRSVLLLIVLINVRVCSAQTKDTIYFLNIHKRGCLISCIKQNTVYYKLDALDSVLKKAEFRHIDSIRFKNNKCITQELMTLAIPQLNYSFPFIRKSATYYKHAVSVNAVTFFNQKLGVNYTKTLNQNFAFWLCAEYAYNKNTLVFDDVFSDDVRALYTVKAGVQLRKFMNNDITAFVTPSIIVQNVIDYRKYYNKFAVAAFAGVEIDIQNNWFISPVVGFGKFLENQQFDNTKIDGFYVQGALNIGKYIF